MQRLDAYAERFAAAGMAALVFDCRHFGASSGEPRPLLGRSPYTVASVGPPGSLAVMNTPDAEPGFRGIDPPGSTWHNQAAARIVLRVSAYRPGLHAGRIVSPILFALAEDDAITPVAFARAAAERAPNSEVRTYPGGHFDIYVGEVFERAVADQVEFLSRHLLG